MPKPTRGDDPAPSTADIDADSNPQQPRRGTLSRSPPPTRVSNFEGGCSPGDALIFYRIDFLMAHEGSQYTSLLRRETDPDTGELYGADATPPARKKSPKPLPSREHQRHNVGEREWRRRLQGKHNRGEARGRMICNLATRINRQNAENDRHSEEVAMRAAREEQAKESTRQQRIQEQRAGLAEQAALLNSPSLRGLGLQLNPDFAAASDAEEDDDEAFLMEVDSRIRAVRAEIDEMGWVSIDRDSVPSVTPPRRTFTSFIGRSPGRWPRTLISNGAPSPVTPISSTAGLTTVSTRTTDQIAPESPVRLARQFLTRAIKGNTLRRRAR